MRIIDIELWRGKRDPEPLEPSAMAFVAEPGKSYHGCLFDRQSSKVCRKASFAAIRAGLPDCDDGFVYVAAPMDPRQIDLLKNEAATRCELGAASNQNT
jgi:hypothetical protein